jgi:hypothetical protein
LFAFNAKLLAKPDCGAWLVEVAQPQVERAFPASTRFEMEPDEQQVEVRILACGPDRVDDLAQLTVVEGTAAIRAAGFRVTRSARSARANSARSAPMQLSRAPGQTASATVEETDNPVGSATSCPYYPSLLVTPPNLTDSVRLTVSGLGTNPPGLPGCSPIEVHPGRARKQRQ